MMMYKNRVRHIENIFPSLELPSHRLTDSIFFTID